MSVCARAPPIAIKDKTIATPEAELLKKIIVKQHIFSFHQPIK